MLKRRQRYDFRSPYTNDIFTMLSIEEILDYVVGLKSKTPRTINADTPVGLYIEIKEYDYYLDTYGIDMAVNLYNALDKYDLSSIEGSTNAGIPIII